MMSSKWIFEYSFVKKSEYSNTKKQYLFQHYIFYASDCFLLTKLGVSGVQVVKMSLIRPIVSLLQNFTNSFQPDILNKISLMVPENINRHVYICAYIHEYIVYTYIHTYIHVCIYMYVYTYMYIHTYIHTYIHYIHMYIHTYIYTLYIMKGLEISDNYQFWVFDRKMMFKQ